jgi:hypothetical protein
MCFGDDQRVTQRDMGYFAIPEHGPAVPEELVTVGAEEFSKRTGGPRTQVSCDLVVIHAEKLEQTGALSNLFNTTGV